jgi:hypothetical protein
MRTNNPLNLKGIGGKCFFDMNLPKRRTSFVVLHKKRQGIQSFKPRENYRYVMDHLLGQKKETEHANETFTRILQRSSISTISELDTAVERSGPRPIFEASFLGSTSLFFLNGEDSAERSLKSTEGQRCNDQFHPFLLNRPEVCKMLDVIPARTQHCMVNHC